ncbi:hypothetical protein GCM10023231_18300 [Olivibacter ginsenosidimutans]|uniref:Arm DNA-binding domain-containing protein n=1 Tax=Olivibacter ginsenosidimutans TaxID=1176537 RepID=A0ABP9B5K8_9SPHI
MNTTITLHIYARAAKANAAGHHPLYVRITIDGKRTEFSSKKFINPKQWDQKMMKMKGNTEEARSINSYLEKLKAKITQTQIVLEYQEIALTLESFMHVFIGKSAEWNCNLK